MKRDFDLEKSELFKSFKKETRTALAKAAIFKKATKGKIVFQEKTQAEGLYFLLKGKIIIGKVLQGNRELELHTIAPHQIFGEISLINQTPHQNFAKATENSEYLIIPKNHFEKIIKKDGSAAFSLSISISRKLSELRHKMIEDEHKTTIAVFYNEGDPKDKAWLALETALYLEEIHNKPETKLSPELKDKKNVLLLDLTSNPQNLENILSKKTHYDYIIINLPAKKDAFSASLIFHADFLINISHKKLDFYKKMYNEKINIVNIDLKHDRKLERLDWRIGNIARTISKSTIGIAFSAAAAGGMAQVGAMKAILEENIPIDMIAGVCGGAMYGSLFAAKVNYNDIVKTFEKRAGMKNAFIKSLSFKPSKLGLASHTKGIEDAQKLTNIKKIEDFKIPLAIVTSDLKKKEKYVFTKGDFFFALKASLALQFIFNPVKYKNTYLMDGVYTTPTPVSVLKENSINKVIAFNVIEDKPNSIQINNILEITMTIKNTATKSIKINELKKADYIINMDTSKYNYFDYKHYKNILDIGINANIENNSQKEKTNG